MRNDGIETPMSEAPRRTRLKPPGRMQPGHHPERNARRERDERGDDAELQGRGRPLGDELVDRLAQPIGNPELAAHRVRDEAAELLDDRVVDPELRPQPGAVGVRRVLPDEVGDRIADELKQGERDDRDHQHDHHRLEQAARDEGDHGPAGSFPPSARFR